MKQLAAGAVLVLISVLPAKATEWMICSAGDDAAIRVLLGQMEVIAVNEVEIEAGARKWSTKPEPGATVITKGQAFETDDQVLIDVTDEAVNAIVAELRLFKTSEGPDQIAAGTLRIAGLGAWAVACSGP